MSVFVAGGGNTHRSLFLLLWLLLSITHQKLQGHVHLIYIRQLLRLKKPQKLSGGAFCLLFDEFLALHIP